jgi:hypothetical protein
MYNMNRLCGNLKESKKEGLRRSGEPLAREMAAYVHSLPSPWIEHKTGRAAFQRLLRERFTDSQTKGRPKPPFFVSGRNRFHKKRAGKSGPSYEGGGTYKRHPTSIRLMRS